MSLDPATCLGRRSRVSRLCPSRASRVSRHSHSLCPRGTARTRETGLRTTSVEAHVYAYASRRERRLPAGAQRMPHPASAPPPRSPGPAPAPRPPPSASVLRLVRHGRVDLVHLGREGAQPHLVRLGNVPRVRLLPRPRHLWMVTRGAIWRGRGRGGGGAEGQLAFRGPWRSAGGALWAAAWRWSSDSDGWSSDSDERPRAQATRHARARARAGHAPLAPARPSPCTRAGQKCKAPRGAGGR